MWNLCSPSLWHPTLGAFPLQELQHNFMKGEPMMCVSNGGISPERPFIESHGGLIKFLFKGRYLDRAPFWTSSGFGGSSGWHHGLAPAEPESTTQSHGMPPCCCESTTTNTLYLSLDNIACGIFKKTEQTTKFCRTQVPSLCSPQPDNRIPRGCQTTPF